MQENIKKSFTGGSYNERAGMDLGNAALGIDYCFQKNEYNYGSFIWNGFVFNYIPKRLVGENIKTSLIIPFEADKYIQALTNGITCTTGYYDAFSAFSWFGFFVFYFLARSLYEPPVKDFLIFFMKLISLMLFWESFPILVLISLILKLPMQPTIKKIVKIFFIKLYLLGNFIASK